MNYSEKEIRIYRLINLGITGVGVLIFLTLSRVFGAIVASVGLYFLFRPFHADERVGDSPSGGQPISQDINNFTVIARMVALYDIVLSSEEYSDRFKGEAARLAAVGVLDAQVYVFQDKSITARHLYTIARTVEGSENPLLDFTVEIGKLIFEVENPQADQFSTFQVWHNKKGEIAKVQEEVRTQYPSGSAEEAKVKRDVEMFFKSPETQEVREQLGIR